MLLPGVMVALTGCRIAAVSAGEDLPAARSNLTALSTAFEARFTNVERAPAFEQARMRLARYAFAPSRLVHDTSLWTGMRSTTTGAVRELEVQGLPGFNLFRFSAQPGARLPSHLGEQRHHITLSQRGKNDWLWHTAVEQHLGSIPPSQVAAILHGLLHSAEQPARTLREDYRSTFPRTTASLGRLISLDSVTTVAQSDGSTVVSLQIVIDASRIQATYPAYAKFLRKYVEATRWRLLLGDPTGAAWFDLRAANQRISMRFRSHDGQLQPLEAHARAMPDTLRLTAEALARFGPFTVGVTNLQGNFVRVSTPVRRAWEMRLTRAPTWHLPLLTKQLMRGPLQYPFAGEGIVFTLGVRQTAVGQSIGERTLELPVRESAIMRFLGKLGFTAMSDFAGAVEAEENRFLAEVFRAMRTDIAGL